MYLIPPKQRIPFFAFGISPYCKQLLTIPLLLTLLKVTGDHTSIPHDLTWLATFFASGHSSGVPIALDMRSASTGDAWCVSYSKPMPNHKSDPGQAKSEHKRLGNWCEWVVLGDSGGAFGHCSKYPTLAGCRGTQCGCRIESLSAKLHLRELSAHTIDRRADQSNSKVDVDFRSADIGQGLSMQC
jgi:hypothetical protein